MSTERHYKSRVCLASQISGQQHMLTSREKFWAKALTNKQDTGAMCAIERQAMESVLSTLEQLVALIGADALARGETLIQALEKAGYVRAGAAAPTQTEAPTPAPH